MIYHDFDTLPIQNGNFVHRFSLENLEISSLFRGYYPIFQPWAWPTSLDLLELPPRPEEAVRCVDLFEETFLGVWLW